MLHSRGSTREPHSTNSSSASMVLVRAGPDADVAVEVVVDKAEGC